MAARPSARALTHLTSRFTHDANPRILPFPPAAHRIRRRRLFPRPRIAGALRRTPPDCHRQPILLPDGPMGNISQHADGARRALGNLASAWRAFPPRNRRSGLGVAAHRYRRGAGRRRRQRAGRGESDRRPARTGQLGDGSSGRRGSRITLSRPRHAVYRRSDHGGRRIGSHAKRGAERPGREWV